MVDIYSKPAILITLAFFTVVQVQAVLENVIQAPGVTVTGSNLVDDWADNPISNTMDNDLQSYYYLDSVVPGSTYVQFDLGSTKAIRTVMIHDAYGVDDEAMIEIWVTDTDNAANDWSDTSERCYSGGRYGVMPCDGTGQYLIVKATDYNNWELDEVMAFAEE